jgi:DNA repair protein RadC
MAAVYEYVYARRKVAEPIGTVHSPADVAALLCEWVRPTAAENERFVLAVLDTQHAIIGVEELYRGNLAGSSVRVCEVFRMAVRMNGAAIVVAHNHPSGDPLPSPDDIAVSRELVAAGHLLNITLLDHVVLGTDGRSASMRALGYLEV